MSSTIVFAISFFAISSAVAEPIRLNLLRRGSGDTEAFQEICDCLGDGYVAGADEAALKSPGSEEERADIACTFLRKFHECLVGKIENSPGPVKKILHLSAAYEYQHLYIAQKVGLCLSVPISPIKTIAENSGIMEQDGWKKIDGQPEKCVGDRMRHCFSNMELSFEGQNNKVNPSFQYLECYEADVPEPACDPPSQILEAFEHNGRKIMKVEWDRIQGHL